jgi:methyl-accepting chemotaxis protein
MKESYCTREISKRAQAVKEVAFQADLLALHAAVARAGVGHNVEEFASAADEVRDLARLGAQVARAYSVVEQEQTF